MIIKFKKRIGEARTLPVHYVTDIRRPRPQMYSRTHLSGWTICGEVHEDYFQWVNNFVATHNEYGIVSGDFETQIYADSQEGYDHFRKWHPYEEWDYADI